MMTPSLIPVPLPLARLVNAIWYLSGSDQPADQQQFITMADGCPGMIFQDPAAGIMSMGLKNLSPLYIYGQATKWSQLQVLGNFEAIGVCFHPAALKRLFGINASQVTDDCIGVGDLGGSRAKMITGRLVAARGRQARVELICRFLEDCLAAANNEDAIVEEAVDRIMGSAGLVELPDLQKRLHITERSLERRFREHVGISANLFARICRFQESMKQLKNAQYSKLSDIAYENGYADQSHYIRTFRSFAGCSPNEYRSRSVPLIESLNDVVMI